MRRLLLFFPLLLAMTLSAQNTVLKGNVFDATTNDPLPFAHLRLLGVGSGTQTNLDGEYTLRLPDSKATDKVVISFTGYRPDTLTLRQLRRQPNVRLHPLTINLEALSVSDFRKPSALLAEVVKRIPDNYWVDTAVGTFFFRRYGLTSDSLWLFCEAIADVMRPGYDKQYYRKTGLVTVDFGDLDSINLAGNHKRYALSRLLVYDTAMLRRMLGDSNYNINPFVGASQTRYNDPSAFPDMLQRTKGNRYLNGKRTRQFDKTARLTTYETDQGEAYYLITRVTERDSTAFVINYRDKALVHYFTTSLRADTIRLPFPFNQFLSGVWSPYGYSQVDYAKIGDRYTLVFSMQATAYGVLVPKKSLMGGKINRTIRDIVTDDVVEDFSLWSLIDLRPSDHQFLDTTQTIAPSAKLHYHQVFQPGRDGDDFWLDYNTIPIESRIADKLRTALQSSTNH